VKKRTIFREVRRSSRPPHKAQWRFSNGQHRLLPTAMCTGKPTMEVESQALPNASTGGCARVGRQRFGRTPPATRTLQPRDLQRNFGAPRARGMRLAGLVLVDASPPFGRPVDEEMAA
jgi:hypothetical protein